VLPAGTDSRGDCRSVPNLAQVYAALAYYYANRDEIDRELEAETADFLRLANETAKSKE
jgi:hypothetical protein